MLDKNQAAHPRHARVDGQRRPRPAHPAHPPARLGRIGPAARDADPAAAREALADCVEESDRVLNMLNTLMDIAEAESGTMRLQCEPVDLCRLIREVVEMYEYVAEEKQNPGHDRAAALLRSLGRSHPRAPGLCQSPGQRAQIHGPKEAT